MPEPMVSPMEMEGGGTVVLGEGEALRREEVKRGGGEVKEIQRNEEQGGARQVRRGLLTGTEQER